MSRNHSARWLMRSHEYRSRHRQLYGGSMFVPYREPDPYYRVSLKAADENHRPFNPYAALYVAIILCAIRDWFNPAICDEQRSASVYLFGDDSSSAHPFSFSNLCHFLHLDRPSFLRGLIELRNDRANKNRLKILRG